MKKYTLGIITASVIASAMPVEAQAFILPPFKIDFSTIANKVLSTTNTISEKVMFLISSMINWGRMISELLLIKYSVNFLVFDVNSIISWFFVEKQ